MKLVRDDAKVGLLVLAAVLVFGGIFFHRTLSALLKKEAVIKVRLTDVAELLVGTEVHLQGLRVGQVNAIETKREGVQYHFVASLGINPDIVLWQGTRGVVVTKIVGGAYIDLKLPEVLARTEVLEPDAILEGETAGSIATLIDQVQDFVVNLNGAITDLRGPIKEKGFAAFMDHPDLLKALRSLDATLVEARTLMVTSQTAVKGVDESMGRNLASLEKTQTVIRGLLENRGDDLDEILVNLSSALKQFDTLNAEARVLLKAEGAEFDITLKTLNRNLKSTEELVELLKAKPNRMLWGKTSEKEKAAAQRKVEEAQKADAVK
jgi:ABC-type transporter Mla subunit MlaD